MREGRTDSAVASLVLEGASERRAYRLEGDRTVIGRAPDVQIVIDHTEVSRRHAQFLRQETAYFVEDLGSKNGTLRNGKRLTERARLMDGDEIVVPGAIFRFESPDETRTSTFFAGRKRVQIDAARGELYVRGATVQLTAKEFLALSYMASRGDAIVKRDDLANAVWPENNGVTSDESIEQLISRLRHKIEEDPSRPQHLVTRRGLGYQLHLDQG